MGNKSLSNHLGQERAKKPIPDIIHKFHNFLAAAWTSNEEVTKITISKSFLDKLKNEYPLSCRQVLADNGEVIEGIIDFESDFGTVRIEANNGQN